MLAGRLAMGAPPWHESLATRIGLVALDLVSLVALPASVLALTWGRPELAVAASITASAASGLRAVALGGAVERSLVVGFRRLVDAARRRPVTELRARDETDESVALLMEAVRETAMFHAVTVPHVIALALALAVLAAAIVVVLGWRWLLLGGAALALAAAFAAHGRAKLKPVQDKAWRDFGELVLDVRVLVDASAELRAHGREAAFSETLLGRVVDVARAERIASTWGAVLSLVPATLAVLALAAPARAGVAWITSALAGSGAAHAGVLGGAGLVIGIALLGYVQTIVRSAPLRASFAAFVAQARARDRERGGAPAGDLFALPIAFESVAYAYPGAPALTPERVSLAWPARRGLALVGDNGAGKSTLALLLLGLLEPTEGAITIGGRDVRSIDLDDLGRRVAFVPQNAFVAPGASVAWHLRLFARGAVSDVDIDRALARVGLAEVLEARSLGKPGREVRAGDLSGGERQRMNLARALVEDTELVVLDEPEAGLDARAREELRALLEGLAATRRVLVIAHDASVVPASFERLRCTRSAELPGVPSRATSA